MRLLNFEGGAGLTGSALVRPAPPSPRAMGFRFRAGVAWVTLAVSILLAPAAGAAARLDSSRPGARLSLEGPLTLRGTLPMSLDLLPPGNYRLRLHGPGLATSLGRLTRFEQGQIGLVGTSGPLALLAPPGYVHLNQGETPRGLLFAAAGIGLGAGVLVKEIARKEAGYDEGQAARAYAVAVSEADFVAARLDYLEAQERRHDSRELRNLWLAVFGVTWGGAALESWLLTPTPRLTNGGGGSYNLSADEAGGSAAALRSLVAPGGGQRYLGHSGRGNFFLGAVTLLGATALVMDDNYLSARRAEHTTSRRLALTTDPLAAGVLRLQLQQDSDRTNSRNHLRWACVGAAAGAYLWNVLDTIGLEKNLERPPTLGLRVEPQMDGMQAGLTWRIQ